MIFLVHYFACFWTYVGLNPYITTAGEAAGEMTWVESNDMQVCSSNLSLRTSCISSSRLSSSHPHLTIASHPQL